MLHLVKPVIPLYLVNKVPANYSYDMIGLDAAMFSPLIRRTPVLFFWKSTENMIRDKISELMIAPSFQLL